MLLVIDVGNTNTVLGIYDLSRPVFGPSDAAPAAPTAPTAPTAPAAPALVQAATSSSASSAPRGANAARNAPNPRGSLLHHFRISTNKSATADEVGDLMQSLIERRGIVPTQIAGCILASVVPQLNRIFAEACTHAFGAPPVVVGPGTKTGMPILVDQPAEVGADRIVNAVAGWQRHKQALIIVDFGTGTTFDAVNAKGEYLGGAIAPGIDIAMDALFSRAAKLPRVELKKPPRVIGKNTAHALQSGLLFGYAGLVDELVSRMKEELATPAKVLATGGLAFLFEGVSRTLESVDEFLTLDGLRIIWDVNASSTATATATANSTSAGGQAPVHPSGGAGRAGT